MKKFLIFTFFILQTISLAFSDQLGNKGYQIRLDNDFFDPFSSTDQFYTHGMAFSLYSSNGIIFKNADTYKNSIRSLIYTPVDISVSDLQDEDRPYGGLLAYSTTAYWRNENHLKGRSLSIGTTGPNSQSDHIQSWWHKQVGSVIPQGWDNQIKNEIILNFSATDNYKIYDNKMSDFYGDYGWSIGNDFIYGSIGATFLFGYNTPEFYVVEVIEPTIKTIDRDNFSLYGIIGTDYRVIARNIFLDGNTFRSSHNVSKYTIVADFTYGVGLRFKNTTLEYTITHRTKEFQEQEKSSRFGSLNLKVLF
jgi:lipid A 3-O-deacylase